ncbi:MAG: glycosyltransferase [Candidatus Jordarchaeaceae archaeon]
MISIGIVPSQPFHLSLGTDMRLLSLMKSLLKMDAEVHFITPFKTDIIPKSERLFVHSPIRSKLSSEAIEKIYSLTRTFFNKSIFTKNFVCNETFLNWMTNYFADKIYKLIKKSDIDIVLGELEIASMALIKLRKSLEVPVITDIHGAWSEEMIAAHLIKENSRQAGIIRKFEKKIFQGADAVIVVSDDAKEFFKKFYDVPEKKMTVVPCGAFPRINEARKVENPSNIVFSGTVTYREHVDLLIKSMPYVLKEYPSAKLYITNKGDKLHEIVSLASRLNINLGLFYYPALSDDYFNFLKACHIGILTSSYDLPRKIAYPAKLFDYMSVGMPVVANDVGAWTRIISENNIGIVTKDSPREFAYALIKLLKNPDLAYECGQRGLNLLRTRFNYDISAKIFYDLCKTIINRSNGG